MPTAGPWPDGVLDGATLVLVETPSNPGLDVCDIRAAAAAAHAAGALLAVDNTTATPLGQRPLELGADLAVASDTKALAGHGDVAARPRHRRRPRARRAPARRPAPAPAPSPARWRRGSLIAASARSTCAWPARPPTPRRWPARCASTPPSADVRWPGLPDDPAHAVAAAQMRRWNGVLRFTLPSADAVSRFLAASRLTDSATSFGGLRSTADRRERWGDAVAPGLVRFSAGCEDTDDLVDDVVTALDAG